MSRNDLAEVLVDRARGPEAAPSGTRPRPVSRPRTRRRDLGHTRPDGARPVLRQLRDGDRLGLGGAAQSARQANLKPRTAEADEVVKSICPYCAVGCGQRIFVKDGEITQIEGDPDSPISRGRLCPKGAASRNLVQSPLRERLESRPPDQRRTETFGRDGSTT